MAKHLKNPESYFNLTKIDQDFIPGPDKALAFKEFLVDKSWRSA